MPYGISRVTVEDYDHWKAIFDEDAANRQRGSSRGGYVFRNRANPDEVIVLLEFADEAAFEAFASSPETRETMGRSGVIGPPDIAFLDLAARPEV
ncbi:MAG TPA: antibiotic biosynthesis monooxygenase [Thermomicrobiales bacterium]|nr:antibiotic biosynthesis monooxygenase [Thermomicrobiales bacterium]